MARQASAGQQAATSQTAASGSTASDPFPATAAARGRRTDIFLSQRAGITAANSSWTDADSSSQPQQQQGNGGGGSWAAAAPGDISSTVSELSNLMGNVTALMNSTFADVGQRIGMAIANSTSLSLVDVGSSGSERLSMGATSSEPVQHSTGTALDRGVSHFGNLLNEAISESTGLPSLPMTG